MKQVFKFIVFIRSVDYPSSDFFRVIVNVVGLEAARNFFVMQGCYVCPDDLSPYLSPRQLSRFKTFYNKPRHNDALVFTVHSYKLSFV